MQSDGVCGPLIQGIRLTARTYKVQTAYEPGKLGLAWSIPQLC